MGVHLYKLPDIGEGVVEAEITVWHVKVGDRVSEEDPIADAMTDKATIELTSPVDGVIQSMACEAGNMLAVGGVLVEFEVAGEGDPSPSLLIEFEPDLEPKAELPPNDEGLKSHAEENAPEKPQASPPIYKSSVVLRDRSSKVLASPAVRGRAARLNIDLAIVPTSDVRISHADLDAFLLNGEAPRSGQRTEFPSPKMGRSPVTASPQPGESQEIFVQPGETRQKVIGLRRVIATRMSEAKKHIPHFTYVEEMDVTALEDLRARLNERRDSDKPKLTVLPLIIRALAVTLVDWPQFNACYRDGSDGLEGGYVSQFEALNLGIAAQTDTGLIVPVIKAAQDKSVWVLATEITRLAEAARNNQLSTADLSDATTTLTSLGPLGGIVTTPVINRPQVAIFGPNKIREKLVLEAGDVSVRKVMNFSVSCDHRVIDGYDAAKMMQDLKARIEDPTSMFIL